LEDVVLKTNFKVHAETCLFILVSSRGCVVVFPMVLGNFLGRCTNHEKKQQNTWMMSIRGGLRHGVQFVQWFLALFGNII
jgi:hypothetical protein